MAAPQFAPTSPVDLPREYESPPVVPDEWLTDRPGEVDGFQPNAPGLGYQGPDQGFAMKIAAEYADRLHVQPGERVEDVLRGCLPVALRRASMFSRAPVVHDLTVAFTVFGFLDPNPPADLVSSRRAVFNGLAHNAHAYTLVRDIVHAVPESTLRMSPAQANAAYPANWRTLTGLADDPTSPDSLR